MTLEVLGFHVAPGSCDATQADEGGRPLVFPLVL